MAKILEEKLAAMKPNSSANQNQVLSISHILIR
jgi:hypothetical protein